MADERTLYITNIDEKVTKDLLEEIFTQAGTVESVSIINGVVRYAFVQFVDEESVPYSIKLMDNLKLYNIPISVRPRANTNQDRLYREQFETRRRHSAGPSRRESSNNYVPDYQPHHHRRSFNENIVNIPGRYNQNVGKHQQQPLPSPIPLRDIFATPVSTKQRGIGGYYNQPPRNNR